jgi:hypothetical protein
MTVGLLRPELLKPLEKSDLVAIPSWRRRIDTKLLSVVIVHHEVCFQFFGRPRRREAAISSLTLTQINVPAPLCRLT